MELRDMRYVTAIAEYGTMTKAAEKLHLSQSTLSLACHALEDELGVRLFQKHGRRLYLTEAGERFCAEADDILTKVRELHSHMEELATQQTKRVRIFSDAVDISSEAILLYTSAFPDVHAEDIRSNTSDAAEALRSGSAELALTLADISDQQIQSELLLEEPMYVLLSRESPLAARATLSLTELEGLPVITQPEGYATNMLARSFYKTAGIQPGPIHFVLDPESIVIQVHHRNGVGFIPESTYCFNKRNSNAVLGIAVAIPLKEEYCRRQVFLSSRKDVSMFGAVAHFTDYLRQFGKLAQSKHCLPGENDFR